MGKYDALAQWLAVSGKDAVSLTFDEISGVIGSPLPASGRRYPAFWANPTVGLPLARVGYRIRSRLGEGRVDFIRIDSHPPPLPPMTQGPEITGRETPDIILVGCVKTKRPGIHPAKNIYRSELFMGRRRYAESLGVPWFILSAKHGLIAPDDEIESYDVALLHLSASERADWGRQILADLDQKIGSVEGKVIEIHAGAEYRDYGVKRGLESRGARVFVPLEHHRRGEQVAWYRAGFGETPLDPLPVVRTPARTSGEDARTIASTIAREFFEGALDLSGRSGAPVPGWRAMPECVAVEALVEDGATRVDVRMALTLVAAMDRARDANRLWANAIRLFRTNPWAYRPDEALSRSFVELRDVLTASGVSQRHLSDSAAWRTILEAMVSPASPEPVRRVVADGIGDAEELRRAVVATTPSGQAWFPLLSGPKISVLWIRMLADPGGARIENVATIPVAVDVQVRKVTEYLGITSTAGRELEAVRGEIQQAWASLADGVAGSPILAGTSAAMDPALWFFGKWGCTFCEAARTKMPISSVCTHCRYGE